MHVSNSAGTHGGLIHSQSKRLIILPREANSRNVDLKSGPSKISVKISALGSHDRPNPYVSKKHNRKSSLDAAAVEEVVQTLQVNKPLSLTPLLVTFVVPEFVCHSNQTLAIIGSGPLLGNWDPSRAIRLTPAGKDSGHAFKWGAEVCLEEGWQGALEFKLAILEGPGVIYEPGSNRLLVVSASKTP